MTDHSAIEKVREVLQRALVHRDHKYCVDRVVEALALLPATPAPAEGEVSEAIKWFTEEKISGLLRDGSTNAICSTFTRKYLQTLITAAQQNAAQVTEIPIAEFIDYLPTERGGSLYIDSEIIKGWANDYPNGFKIITAKEGT